MENIKCPYCDMTVRVAEIEAEDGACPECGAPLMGVLLRNQEGAEDFEDDLDTFAESDVPMEDDIKRFRRKNDDDDDDDEEEDD